MQQALPSSASVFIPIGYQSSSCGYCKDVVTGRRTQDSSANYYIHTTRLQADHYQLMVDRGMRRSGTLVYKPDVKRACCPHYTISLPAKEFKPSRDQRQAINRWNRFVLGDGYINEVAKRYPKSKKDKAKQKNSFDLLEAVHESEHERLKRPPEPAHKFEVDLEAATFSEEKYKLFENYQANVHHEKPHQITRSGFKRFLCDSPIPQSSRMIDGKEQRLGSFHQCYRLDGRLIAIGVLDLLPHCVSGVYFIYHQDFEQFSFGKLSALREAALAIEESYGYYYMGFYIHSCQKMRYKGTYKPQRILDPESLEWFVLDDRVVRLLDKQAYVPIKRELQAQDQSESHETQDFSATSSEGSNELRTVEEASDAAAEGLSLCSIGVPGIMSMDEVEAQVGLADITVLLGPQGPAVPAQLLLDMGLTSNPNMLKELLLDMAACVGVEVAKNMAVKLSG